MSVRAHLLPEVRRLPSVYRFIIGPPSWNPRGPRRDPLWRVINRVFRRYIFLFLFFFYAPATASKPLWLVVGRFVAESAQNAVNKVSRREEYIFFFFIKNLTYSPFVVALWVCFFIDSKTPISLSLSLPLPKNNPFQTILPFTHLVHQLAHCQTLI